MSKTNTVRNIATEIKWCDSCRTEKLTYIGSGTTCIVYQTESKDIVKEFFPLIRENNEFVEAMTRDANGKAVYSEALAPHLLKDIQEREENFYSQTATIDELNCRYRDEEDNMFLIPKDMPKTSLGRCHWCNYIGGHTLEKVFGESKRQSCNFQQHFLTVLPFIISLYDEIAFYHGDGAEKMSHRGFLNLDIKPENLFAIKSQGEYIGVRNLDFGSVKRLEDKYQGEILIERGLITQIREYAQDHNYSAEYKDELLIDRINSKFFVSSPSFYDKDRISATIKKSLDPSKSIDGVISDFKLLDILAAWKMFLLALSDSSEAFAVNTHCKNENEKERVYKAFAEIFENNQLTANNSLFESYNIYCQLYEIMARSFSGTRRYRLSASQIAARLRNIWCLFNGIPDNKKTAEQKCFEDLNAAFRARDELLSAHGLTSIKDILDFCKVNEAKGIKTPEKLGELHWFLRYGQTHG